MRDEGGKVRTYEADVRDMQGMQAAIDDVIAELGPSSIVVANAGISPVIGEVAFTEPAWREAIDVMLTGVVNTIEACLPDILAADQGGSIVH